MVDKDLVMAKAGLVRKHLNRVELKCSVDLPAFLADLDRQESVASSKNSVSSHKETKERSAVRN
jgi:hypothetical protein